MSASAFARALVTRYMWRGNETSETLARSVLVLAKLIDAGADDLMLRRYFQCACFDLKLCENPANRLSELCASVRRQEAMGAVERFRGSLRA